MSDKVHVLLVGATGLVGSELMRQFVGRLQFRFSALARREVPLPRGVRMEMRLAQVDQWGEVIAEVRPDCVICALGTTWQQAGRDEAAFRAVDQKLVVQVARAAKEAGARHFILVSSVGASLAAKGMYLRVKGETERDVAKLGFGRLDVLRPGLLRGRREGDRRRLERLGILLSPLTNLLLHGKYRKYRAIDARVVARAALSLAGERPGGRYVHEYASIQHAARRLAD